MKPRSVVFLTIWILLTVSWRNALAQGKRHYIVGIDRSASRTSQQMKDMRDFLGRLVADVTYGDAVSMMQIFRSDTDRVVEFRGTVPMPRVPENPGRRDQLALATAKSSFNQYAQRFTDTVGIRSVTTTDIFGFLRRASNYARSDDGRRVVLVVLSDMLQSVPGMNFERAGAIPSQRWIEDQAREGLLPRLTGACVVAVGVEEGTLRAVRVRDFWIAYIQAAGATLKLENYRAYMTPSDIRC